MGKEHLLPFLRGSNLKEILARCIMSRSAVSTKVCLVHLCGYESWDKELHSDELVLLEVIWFLYVIFSNMFYCFLSVFMFKF